MIPHAARSIAPRAGRLAAAAACAVLALAAAACTSDADPPPRNPVGPAPEATTAAAAPATPATATPAAPAATPAPAPTPPPTAEGAPSPERLEALVGNAIELMAEWLGVPATDLALAEAEALVWPDGCLGAPMPGGVCTMALVPGFRVVLTDGFGGRHRAHGDADGQIVRWVGERILTGTVTASTRDSLTLAAEDGEVTLVGAPGSEYWGRGLSPGARDLTEVAAAVGGAQVAVGADPSPDGGEASVIAWLVVTE